MASASSIKQILLEWCRSKTVGYQVSGRRHSQAYCLPSTCWRGKILPGWGGMGAGSLYLLSGTQPTQHGLLFIVLGLENLLRGLI